MRAAIDIFLLGLVLSLSSLSFMPVFSSLQSSCNQKKLEADIQWEPHRQIPTMKTKFSLFVCVGFIISIELRGCQMAFDYLIPR